MLHLADLKSFIHWIVHGFGFAEYHRPEALSPPCPSPCEQELVLCRPDLLVRFGICIVVCIYGTPFARWWKDRSALVIGDGVGEGIQPFPVVVPCGFPISCRVSLSWRLVRRWAKWVDVLCCVFGSGHGTRSREQEDE